MSDESRPNKRAGDSGEGLPPGVARLVAAALNGPEPPADAETASQARVVSAYEEARLEARPLRADDWNAGVASGLAGRVSRFLRRLGGR